MSIRLEQEFPQTSENAGNYSADADDAGISTGDEEIPSKSTPGKTAPTEDQDNGCPSPLSWREVLETFRAQSSPWEFTHDQLLYRGYIWGTGPPLYFLNCLGGSHELYALLGWLLREEFQCVLFDYPTVAGRQHLSVDDYAAGFCAIADLHGHANVTVYASGFGSAVALAALVAEPQRIDRAVIQAGYAHRSLSLSERLVTRLGRWLPGRLRTIPAFATIQRQNHRRWFPPFDHGRWSFFEENAGDSKMAAVARRAHLLADFDIRTSLLAIRQPILLVQTEGEGKVLTCCRQELLAGLPNARCESIDSTGLIPFLTHPHRLAKVIRPFLHGELSQIEDTVVRSPVASHDVTGSANLK